QPPPRPDTNTDQRCKPEQINVTTILTVFGTRPEVIKLAPVIHALESAPDRYRTVNVASGQHTTLLYPFVDLFAVRVDYDLRVMQAGQNPNDVCARVLNRLDAIL